MEAIMENYCEACRIRREFRPHVDGHLARRSLRLSHCPAHAACNFAVWVSQRTTTFPRVVASLEVLILSECLHGAICASLANLARSQALWHSRHARPPDLVTFVFSFEYGCPLGQCVFAA